MNKPTNYEEINYTAKVLQRCEKQGDCLIWQGAKHKQNYGMMRYWGKMKTTHQIIGIEKYGNPQDTGQQKFTQTCGNSLCCNPDHIELTTHSKIMSSFVSTRKPKRGVHNELTKEKVLEIKNAPDTGWGTKTRLAKKYGISDTTVGKIRRGQAYKWIQ